MEIVQDLPRPSEMVFPDIPVREDCPSCPETGPRCDLHESMHRRALKRQQELGQADQHHEPEPDQSACKDIPLSKKQRKDIVRAKDKDYQVLAALSRMKVNDSAKPPRASKHSLSKKQKKRVQQEEDAALYVADPVKIAKRLEKQAQRLAAPERIAKLEAYRQNKADKDSRAVARRGRLAEQQRKNSKACGFPQIMYELGDLKAASLAEQKRSCDAARELSVEIQDSATVYSMPVGDGTDDFLARASSLISETLCSTQSSLSTTDQMNLKEALSLVRTTQLLSTNQSVRSEEHRNAVEAEPNYSTPRLIVRDVPIRPASPVDHEAAEPEQEYWDLYSQLKGAAGTPVYTMQHMSGAEHDAMME